MYKIVILTTLLLAAGCATAQQKADNSKMEITQMSKKIKLDSSSPTFTGNVELFMYFKGNKESQISGAEVTFMPGARAAWHTHPKGQRLIVTSGEGYVQQWGEPARKIKKGDVIWTPPGVKHWHGAGATKKLTHIALQEIVNGSNVDWLEKVSDKQYKQALSEK